MGGKLAVRYPLEGRVDGGVMVKDHSVIADTNLLLGVATHVIWLGLTVIEGKAIR